MTLLAQTATGWIENRLGYTPEDPAGVLGILNAAGESLVAPPLGHAWTWLTRETLATLTSGQNWIALEDDFQALLDVRFAEDFVASIKLTTVAHLVDLERMPQVGLCYAAALLYTVPSGGSEPVPRLRITPTPDATEVDALKIVYRAGWSELAHAASPVLIPHWVVPLYRELVIAYAMGWSEPDESPVASASTHIAAAWTGAIAMAALERDGGVQRYLGKPTNTILPAIVRGGSPTPYANDTVTLI